MMDDPSAKSPMIYRLPDEILLQIVDNLHQFRPRLFYGSSNWHARRYGELYGDLRSVSLVSQRFQACGQEILFRDLVLVRGSCNYYNDEGGTSESYQGASFVNLARTLLERPALRKYVKILSIEPNNYKYLRQAREKVTIPQPFPIRHFAAQAETSLRQLGFDIHIIEQWILNLIDGYVNAYLGLVLALIPNLGVLFINRYWGDETVRIHELFCDSPNAHAVVTEVAGLKAIKILDVTSLSQLQHLPSLPNLRILRVNSIMEYGSGSFFGNLSEFHSSLGFVDPYHEETVLNFDAMSRLFSCMNTLKILRLSHTYGQLCDTTSKDSFGLYPQDFNKVIMALSHVHPTLQTLELPQNWIEVFSANSTPIQTLQCFQRLRRLIISKVAMIGFYYGRSDRPEDAHDPTAPALGCLPQTLQHLEIHQADRATCSWLLPVLETKNINFPVLSHIRLCVADTESRHSEYITKFKALADVSCVPLEITRTEFFRQYDSMQADPVCED
ncbi:hypothetical protein P154DRAFT_65967 [Amniculicola lignicola CBS 123094]|uniref:F-box domain-containing protein n=1 Tax=Amniculicola lignicola CBS 123094 TaxID=1392246 RepID=A0A6A5WQE0_9PLEO|nr:hypothetical protein P154DRAFT_65967 [Amniculicola lignicola CBS 123094]